MLQHGRKSQHSAMLSGVSDVNWPPVPPNNINAAAQSVWRETIANLTADALPKECYSLFSVWCSLKTELDEVMLALTQFPSGVPTRSEDLKRYKVLIKMRTALTREFSQLSSKLRLTPQQRLDAHRAPRVSSGSMPWDQRRAASEQADLAPQQRPAPSVNGPWGQVAVAGEDQQP